MHRISTFNVISDKNVQNRHGQCFLTWGNLPFLVVFKPRLFGLFTANFDTFKSELTIFHNRIAHK